MRTGSIYEAIFNSFPEPVLLLEGDGVAYRSPAAAELFPGLKAGERIPEELEGLVRGVEPPAAVTGEVRGRSWTISLQAVEEGVLAVLRPLEPGGGPDLERLTTQLRRETAAVGAALQRLDPTEEEPDAQRLRKYLSAADRGLCRLLRLADHLEVLDLPDKLLYRPGPLDLAGLCRELAAQVEPLCRQMDLRFLYESEELSLLTTGDEGLLRRMLLGLISNAMKAAGPEGSLGLRLARSRGRAVLTVWDSGQGLGAEELSRLFGGGEGGTSLSPRRGLGLGLTMVRRGVRLHGGVMMAEARPGEGLRCVLSLPIRIPEGGGSLRSPRADYSGGFSPVLVELSDVLPAECFLPEELF